ncbi:YbfB/YjiJ family MFS transporter [Erwinia psidii]|uniref:YbfB/YjiJ family MFS transporter n=1 Tax=Erwinia psidii TaxID=69224 RepID=A0A3N6SLV4_9GAMM|nr:YbfB/YjiJ family MFS transporter [Erwinia psidii]RQM39841.1 YbfB/YjiJ family MFS transporter [Erwinia psidii]
MAVRVALSAFLSLVVIMGIGRFAFTPQVPLMIGEHQLSLTSTAVVAALNYLGYLFGAYDAMRATRHVELRLLAGIAGAVVLTLLSACVSVAWLHGVIRFLAGWSSGWGLVLIAAWSGEKLHILGRPDMSAAVFAGPGVGILLCGLLAWILHIHGASAATAWFIYGLLALFLLLPVARYLPRKGELHRPAMTAEPLMITGSLKRLVWSYSLAGFGYILPATFLSQLAISRFPHSELALLAWPLFGGASVAGIVLGIATRHTGRASQRLAITLWLQALGIVCADRLTGISGLVLGAILIGGGFLNVVQLSLFRARELAPQHARYMAGLLTTGYAIGQLLGPLFSALSTALSHQLEPALYLAGAGLLLAGVLAWWRDAGAE